MSRKQRQAQKGTTTGQKGWGSLGGRDEGRQSGGGIGLGLGLGRVRGRQLGIVKGQEGWVEGQIAVEWRRGRNNRVGDRGGSGGRRCSYFKIFVRSIHDRHYVVLYSFYSYSFYSTLLVLLHIQSQSHIPLQLQLHIQLYIQSLNIKY